MKYDFATQLELGKQAEVRIDRLLLSIGYTIAQVGMDMERIGIDRVLTAPSGRVITAEYKADFRMRDTGNLFLETAVIHERGGRKAGWAVGSQADVALYWCHPGQTREDSLVFVLDMPKLAKSVPTLVAGRKKIHVPNNGYYAEGYAVPMRAVWGAASKAKLTMKKEFLQ